MTGKIHTRLASQSVSQLELMSDWSNWYEPMGEIEKSLSQTSITWQGTTQTEREAQKEKSLYQLRIKSSSKIDESHGSALRNTQYMAGC